MREPPEVVGARFHALGPQRLGERRPVARVHLALRSPAVRLVGADTLSVEADTDDYHVHRILLGAGVVIVEGLALSAVAPGPYEFVCLPLRIAGGDGAPARAVLIQP